MGKRIVIVLLLAGILGGMLALPAGAVDLQLAAPSAVLMDLATGTVLYETNSHERLAPASVTKVMTLLLIMEAVDSGKISWQDTVTASEAAAAKGGSQVYLKVGETMSVEEMVKSITVSSANDCACAMAEFLAGSEAGFVEKMNARAKELGMEDTHFVNPNGLSDSDHYSSAYDLALLARACLENETLAGMVSTKSISLGGRVFTNHNKLLWQYEGCVGLKTGYTEKAGRTLVSAAEREGTTLICVTLDDPNDWADHAALFDEGFARWESRLLAREGEVLCRLPVSGGLLPLCPVEAGEEARLCLEKGQEAERELVLDQTALTAPVAAGTVVGRAVYRAGTAERSIPLVAGETVGCCLYEAGPLKRLLDSLGELLPG